MSCGKGGASFSERCATRKQTRGCGRGVAVRPQECRLLCEPQPGGAGGAGRGGRGRSRGPRATSSGLDVTPAAGAPGCAGRTGGRRRPKDGMLSPGAHPQRSLRLFLFPQMAQRKDIRDTYGTSLNTRRRPPASWERPS